MATHGMEQTRVYAVWRNMKSRCLNPSDQNYHNYGGRGITVCTRWMAFENFLEDMGVPPSGLSLERVDNDLGYDAANCIWATRKQQANNRRTSVYLEAGGLRMTKTEWALHLGITFHSLTLRIRKWGLPLALTTPKKCN